MPGQQNAMEVIQNRLQQPDSGNPSVSEDLTQGMPATPNQDTQVNASANVSSSITAGELRSLEFQRKLELDRKAEARQLSIDEANELKELRKQEDAQRSEIERSTRQTISGIRDTINSVGQRSASIPTPRGLAFPLTVLAVFFLLLIPVNGHTRLTWIWLTLSGNAEIQETENTSSGNSSSSSNGNTPIPTTTTLPYTPPPGQLVPLVAAAPTGGASNGAYGTYAEDI